mgnify:CR=1 FL=1
MSKADRLQSYGLVAALEREILLLELKTYATRSVGSIKALSTLLREKRAQIEARPHDTECRMDMEYYLEVMVRPTDDLVAEVDALTAEIATSKAALRAEEAN